MALVAGAAVAKKPAPPAPEPPAPTLTAVAPAVYDATVVQPHKGKILVVSFWASYCAPCMQEMPMLLALAEERKADVDVVLVSTDPKEWREKATKIVVDKKAKVPLFWADSDDPQPFIDAVDKAWAGEMPFTVVYGKDGARKASLSGEQTRDAIVAAIERAAAP